MKEQAMQKINTAGKVGYIISTIIKAIIVTGAIAVLVAAILCFSIPEETLQMKVKSDMLLSMDVEALGETIAIDDEDKIEAILAGEDVDVDWEMEFEDEEYSAVDVEVVDNEIHMQLVSDESATTLHSMGWSLVLACIALTITGITMQFVCRLCKEFRDCTSPFAEGVIKKMENLSIALIPWAFVSSIIDSMRDSFFRDGISITLSIDLGVVLVVCIVLVLVYVFKYGAMLQQESDETL